MRTLVVAWLAVAACAGRNGGGPPAEGEEKMDDRYVWGETACGGIALGLRVESRKVEAGRPIVYHLAVANRSGQEKAVTLFYDLDAKYRTRVVATHGKSGKQAVRGAVGSKVPTTSGYRIEVKLAADEVHERAGDPLTLDAEARGVNTLKVHYGGTEAMTCEVVSGTIEVEIL